MAGFIKVLILENEIEADLIGSILAERKIPYTIKSYHDMAYNGVYQFRLGWGHLEAPAEFKGEILAIYGDLPVKGKETGNNAQ
ncbi:MAG: hypothetical protein ACM3WV_06920 [Bacillota bacterium]